MAIRSLLLTSAVFIYLMNPAFSQQSGDCSAVITEISGKALVRESGMTGYVKAVWGMRLFRGDQVATDDKSEVKLLFHDNSFIVLGPNSTFTVSGGESAVTKPAADVKRYSSAAVINFSALAVRREESKDIGALAGVRSATFGAIIDPGMPYNTTIRQVRPSFSWLPRQEFESYTVNLYDSNGLVWSRKVKEPTMKYPDDVRELEYGKSYFWNVEGEAMIDTEKSDSHRFTLVSADQLKALDEYESLVGKTFPADEGGSSLHSVMGAYYIEQGLLQDAIGEFSIISELNEDAPLPHEILGSLYSEVGEKDKAIKELQKALELTNKENN